MADHKEIHNTHSHTQEHEAHIGIPGYFGDLREFWWSERF